MGFAMSPNAIEDYSLSPRRYDPSISHLLKKLEATHLVFRFADLVDSGLISIASGDEIGKLAYGTGSIPFVRTSDLSNWEIKADPKHCVSEEIYESFRNKQDIREDDILIVKNGPIYRFLCNNHKIRS